MMFYGTQNSGLRSNSCHQTGLKRKKLSGTPSRVCSERAKAAVRQHQRLSGAKVNAIAGERIVKKDRYYQTAVHKNITRDRLARSTNPVVGVKLRAILDELKRKGEGHE